MDAVGNRIEDDTAYASDLAPRQSTQKDMFVLVSGDKYDAMKAANIKIVEASMY